jgi:hypothetical protein
MGDEALEADCRALSRLNEMATASLSDISKAIDELFGERIGKEQRRILAERYDRRSEASSILTAPRGGAVKAPAVVTSTAGLREVPATISILSSWTPRMANDPAKAAVARRAAEGHPLTRFRT